MYHAMLCVTLEVKVRDHTPVEHRWGAYLPQMAFEPVGGL